MRRLFQWTAGLAMAGLVATAAWAAGTKTLTVQYKEAQIRSAPSYASKIVRTLNLGDSVTVVESKGEWHRIQLPDGTSGWVNNAAVTSGRVNVKGGQETAKSGASGDELALAGKGFNSDIENQFKKGHKDIDFRWIDKMEAYKVSTAETQAFLKEGGVAPQGGAQ